jgi:hypothetical protein
MPPDEQRAFLAAQLRELLEHHRAHCPEYARLLGARPARRAGSAHDGLDGYPFLPVTLFKEYDLSSTDGPALSLHSSSTTSDSPSRIQADRATRSRQSLSAHRILGDFVGDERRPYLVFDAADTVRGTASMSAKGAAIMSLAHLASEFHFVARQEEGDLAIDEEALGRALDAIGDRPFLAYGFTYILYQLHARWRAGLDVTAHPRSVFLHSGGWKRLTHLAVDKRRFNETVAGIWGLPPANVIDFYGVVEQAGLPYPDCSAGFKHVPYWADVIIRRSDTLDPAPVGETGLIQLVSCVPLSAPNHSVLTEDLGELVLLDGCACGRRGKAFVFRGRAPRSELRGCSDVPRT